MKLNEKIKRVKKSPWVFHLNSGSCNACDIEILDTLTPYFDAERLGVKLVASPRHADIILLTGPITRESLPKIIRALRAVPKPRIVVVIGSCAVGGGVWWDTYSTLGGFPKLQEILKQYEIELDKVVYVPGCPARPEAIIHGLLLPLGYIEQKVSRIVIIASQS